MFEQFTTQARTVVHDARQESRDLGHYYVGTEHLLLALLAPQAGIPSTVLGGAGLTVERVRADIESYLAANRAPGRLEADVLGPQDAEALEAIGIDLDAVRAKIEETFGPGALCPAPRARRRLFRRRRTQRASYGRFTARSKKVLELSLRESVRLRHDDIGTEHILLGLIREGEGLAAKIICDAGISLDDLRRRTLDSLAQAA
jgi:ATP-dependent Clp protease ATP-binding subunit ClpA